MGLGEGNTCRLTDEIRFPHSLGLLYSAFTAFLGFEVNEGEYKVMGMAPYGVPRFVDEVRRVVRTHDDGSFETEGEPDAADQRQIPPHGQQVLLQPPAVRRVGPAVIRHVEGEGFTRRGSLQTNPAPEYTQPNAPATPRARSRHL